MPSAHRKHAEWTPSRLIRWGETIGPHTAALVEAILERPRPPRAGLPLVPGHPAAGQAYGDERLEVACARARGRAARSYRHVDSILKHGLDRLPQQQTQTQTTRASHEHVRGAAYYHPNEEDPC